jgi:hypothetical protein
MYLTLQCVTGGSGCVESIYYRSYTVHCEFDQIPNLQNCFTTPKNTKDGNGLQIDKHLPPSIFTGQFLRIRIGVYKLFVRMPN